MKKRGEPPFKQGPPRMELIMWNSNARADIRAHPLDQKILARRLERLVTATQLATTPDERRDCVAVARHVAFTALAVLMRSKGGVLPCALAAWFEAEAAGYPSWNR